MAMLSVSKLTGAVVGFLEGLGPGVPAPTPWAEPVLAQIPVVGQQYCAPYTVDLTVANKPISISDGDFAVTDVNGNLVFKVKSKVLSLRDRRVLVDAAGNTIISMQQKLMSIRKKWEVFKGESTDKKDLLFSTKKSSLIQFKTELDVFLASNTSKKVCDFKIKGSYLERSCSIFLGETSTIIAQMSRKYSVTNVVMGKDTFGVTICSNMDHAFIVALIVILHDINKEKEV